MKDKNLKQIEFERNRELNHLERLVNVMKLTNIKAYKMLQSHWLDGEIIEGVFDGENTTIILPSNEAFEKLYGPIKVVFKGSLTKKCNLVNIEPRQYFEDCHISMPITYKGLTIPNKQIYKFKVDYYYASIK